MKGLFNTVLLLALGTVSSNVFGMNPIESGKKPGSIRALLEQFERNEPAIIARKPITIAKTHTQINVNDNTKRFAPRGSALNNHPNIAKPIELNENLNSNTQNNRNKSEPVSTPEPGFEIANNNPHQPHAEISDAKPAHQDSDRIKPTSPKEDWLEAIIRLRPQEDDDNFSDTEDSFDDITSPDAKALSEEETRGQAMAHVKHEDSNKALTNSPAATSVLERARKKDSLLKNIPDDHHAVTHGEWEDGELDPNAPAPILLVPLVEQAPVAQVNAPARRLAPTTTEKSPKEETAPEYDAWPGKNILITAGLYFLIDSLQHSEYATKIKTQYPKSSAALFTLSQEALAANAVQQLLPGESANSLAFTATFTALHMGELLLKKVVSTLAKKAPFNKLALAFKKLSPTKQANLKKLGNFAGWGIKTLIARKLSS